MSDIKDWSVTAGGNNATPPDGWPEGMNRTDVNDTAREMMAAVARFYRNPLWLSPFESYTVTKDDDSTIRIAVHDATDVFVAGLRVRVSGGATNLGIVTSSELDGGDTLVHLDVDGDVALHASSSKIEFVTMLIGLAAMRGIVDAGGSLADASAAISVGAFDDLVNDSVTGGDLGSAALLDAGSMSDIPLWSELGDVVTYNVGAGSGEIPTNADIDSKSSQVVEISIESTNNTASATWVPSNWSAVAITDANGGKYFRISVLAFFEEGDDVDQVRIHCGSAGTVSDPVVANMGELESGIVGVITPSGAGNRGVNLATVVRPSSGDKVTVAVVNDSADPVTRRILTTSPDGAPARSLLVIQEV